jgi:phosphatidylglycerol:prolipoprotein diacylglycerol transferase
MGFEPLIPYVQLPEQTLLPARFIGGFPSEALSIKPFGTLVVIGIYVGAHLAARQGRRMQLDAKQLSSFVTWGLIAGFIGGHVLDTLFYYPGQVLADPLSLLRLWDGLSSFGGFAGAIVGVLLWGRYNRTKILPYADAVLSSFPIAWMFGRAGCSVAHDHPGIHSDLWFAVRYPDGGRFDLGLLEFSYTVLVVLAFLALRKRPRPTGFYVAAVCILYAPVRFLLDFLRVETGARLAFGAIDPRYGGLTPAQWACFALLGFGVVMFFRVLVAGEGSLRSSF